MRPRSSIPGQPVKGYPADLPVMVGLDLSLTGTGMAAITAGRLETATLRSTKKGVVRLSDLRARLRAFLLTHKPELVVVEGYSFASKNSRAHSTGEWGGVARLLLHDMGFPFVNAPPSNLKLFATGSHNSRKPEIVMNLLKRWQVEVPREDEADATVAALVAAAIHRPTAFELLEFQRRALAKIAQQDE